MTGYCLRKLPPSTDHGFFAAQAQHNSQPYKVCYDAIGMWLSWFTLASEHHFMLFFVISLLFSSFLAACKGVHWLYVLTLIGHVLVPLFHHRPVIQRHLLAPTGSPHCLHSPCCSILIYIDGMPWSIIINEPAAGLSVFQFYKNEVTTVYTKMATVLVGLLCSFWFLILHWTASSLMLGSCVCVVCTATGWSQHGFHHCHHCDLFRTKHIGEHKI